MTKAKVSAAVLLTICLAPRTSIGEEARKPGPLFVIVQPGYAGSTKDAESFVKSLVEHLSEKVPLKGLQGEYHNEAGKGLEAIAKGKPAFGVVSFGFYLEHRERFGLEALLEARPRDNFVVVVRAGEGGGADSLKGKPVAGGPLHERLFLERVAFRGKADTASWDSKPVLHVSRALRDLVNKKTYAAVVLTGRDYRALSALYGPKTLEKALESEYYAPALLVAFGSKPEGPPQPAGRPSEETARKEAERETAAGKVKRAFLELPRDPKGRKILETMGSEGFEELAPEELKVLKELEGRYAAQDKK